MIRILTDSASDILPAEAQQLGVTVIPLNVTLEDGTVLRDGIDMTPSEYYTHLAACRKLPTTSQPSPEQFERLYLDAAAAGDEVLGIFLSDALSGTGQCARLAADLANVDNVVFVNTENVCLGQSLLVRLAVQLRDAGKTITQIAADLEKAKQHLHLVAAVDDLKYLRKGGRLSAAAAVAGGMLGIKPILAVMEGKVALAGKARGLPGVYVALFKKIDEMGGIHPGYTPLLGYTVNHRELQPLLTYLQDNLHLDAPLVRQIGCVIGTHTGPGAFGIALFHTGNTQILKFARSASRSLIKSWRWNKTYSQKQVGQPAGCPTLFFVSVKMSRLALTAPRPRSACPAAAPAPPASWGG